MTPKIITIRLTMEAEHIFIVNITSDKKLIAFPINLIEFKKSDLVYI